MKKNDIALIVLIVSISLVITYFVAKAFIGNPQSKQVTAEVVEPIKPDLVDPSGKIFNRDAINPTIVIQIGNPSNQQPFGQ
jgi:hypothetical protein